MMPELHSDIAHLFPETGYIRGLEFYLKRDTGGSFNWWASYTYSQARETHSSTQGSSPQIQNRGYYYRLTNNRTTRTQEAETWFPLLPSFTLSAEF